jgi:hypothetical protein
VIALLTSIMSVSSSSGHLPAASAILGLAAVAVACVETNPSQDGNDSSSVSEATVTVTVDVERRLATVGPYAFGMHTSVYDNALHDPQLPELLAAAGITMLRYPGGGYSDNYHWSTHTMTPWSDDPEDTGWLAEGSDFGSYVTVLERAGTAVMITVNYGSNLAGDGPGEPQEAAAWVAYANGEPDDETPIGVDSSGHDWNTVGYWASLRASEPLTPDDGQNFLRISHPEPLGIEYWEVGNEVFGNGYYGTAFEHDLHVPYDDETPREGHPDLSPTTYGRGVVDYVRAMKAVDPTIKVGAVLNTPPEDYSWGPDWNQNVLSECGREIDFGIVHWYTGGDPGSLLRAPRTLVAEMSEELSRLFSEYCGEYAGNLEVAMTELGPRPGISRDQGQAVGIFAADVYVTLIEHRFVNIAWLELHNGSFLSEYTPRQGPAYKGIQMAHHLASPGDTLVAAISSRESVLVAHAADRADDSVAVMLVNTAVYTKALVTVEIGSRPLATEGVAYHYRPEGSAGDGAVTGPLSVSELGNTFSVEVPPYSVTDLIIAAAQ